MIDMTEHKPAQHHRMWSNKDITWQIWPNTNTSNAIIVLVIKRKHDRYDPEHKPVHLPSGWLREEGPGGLPWWQHVHSTPCCAESIKNRQPETSLTSPSALQNPGCFSVSKPHSSLPYLSLIAMCVLKDTYEPTLPSQIRKCIQLWRTQYKITRTGSVRKIILSIQSLSFFCSIIQPYEI